MSNNMESSTFETLRELVRYTRKPELEEEGRDRLIRFLDSTSDLRTGQAIVDSLCIHFGLFPYMSPSLHHLSTSEALAYEYHKPAVSFRDDEFVFHSDQAKIFYRLLDGESIVLSAPTSFGKSAILDAIIASEKWETIVIIVPTIALIDEVRRRIVKFAFGYKLITHPGQDAGRRNIYLLTQERYLELPSVPNVDFFMIDEFYKLGTGNTDDQRMSLLNIAWNQLRSTGAQYYLTGPNVDSLAESLDGGIRDSLYVSNYRTVAVDVEDRSNVEPDSRIADMAHYWSTLEGSTLVFVASPPRAERTAIDISRFESVRAPSELARAVATWLGDNYHPAWRIIESLRHGVATHTGPMPRSLQRIMIRLFADGGLSTLVCTTTLIEGVNTSARNVIIFDKTIDRKPIDYFTFSNVRGRAGRMSSHFIGRVVTYMTPPQEALTEVDIPIDSQSQTAPLSSIVQLSDAELTERSRSRLDPVVSQEFLSLETIKANRGFDPELQIEAARILLERPISRRMFAWSGYPNSRQSRAVLEFAFDNLLTGRQRRGMNINKVLGLLASVRDTGGDFGQLIDRQMRYKRPDQELSDVIAEVLAFQRNWMGFTIPSLLRATQRIYNEVARSQGELSGNYEFYLSEIENLFLPSSLLDLDEYGLPLPLALKLSELGMAAGRDVSEVLASFTELARRELVRKQLSEVELWIVDDVLEGLGA